MKFGNKIFVEILEYKDLCWGNLSPSSPWNDCLCNDFYTHQIMRFYFTILFFFLKYIVVCTEIGLESFLNNIVAVVQSFLVLFHQIEILFNCFSKSYNIGKTEIWNVLQCLGLNKDLAKIMKRSFLACTVFPRDVFLNN